MPHLPPVYLDHWYAKESEALTDAAKETSGSPQYCYHCGGELADGALPLIFPSDSAPADPRPGESCGCEEAVWNPEAYDRISDPRMARASEWEEDGQP